MAQIYVKYNPYRMMTQIDVNGKTISNDSILYKVVKGKRMQEWIGKFPEMLVEELNTVDFDIEFYGMALDWDDFEDAFVHAQKSDIIKKLNLKFIEGKSDEGISEKIISVFTDLQEGPIDDFRDQKLIKAFESINNSVFPINVIATMSSGKSTLINALLGRRLMPSKNEACTATITEILDNDQEQFSAVVYDENDQMLQDIPELTYDIMNDLNDDDKVHKIEAEGNIPFLDARSTALMLVDTPGPNNSQNQAHKNTTYRAINSDSNNLILYVLNGTQLSTNDDASLLSYVAEQIKKGGKQVRDRFIFVINKMDGFNPEEENIGRAIQAARRYLASYGIEDPQIFPCSAYTALNIRTYLDGIDIENMTRSEEKKLPSAARDTLPMIDKFIEYESMHLEQYSTLSPSAQRELDYKLDQAEKNEDTKEQALIHCGIYSIEAAITAYLKKNIYPSKINEIIRSIEGLLDEFNIDVKFDENIVYDSDKLDIIREQIANAKKKQENDKAEKSNAIDVFQEKFYDLKEKNMDCQSKTIQVNIDNEKKSDKKVFGVEVGEIAYKDISNASTIIQNEKKSDKKIFGVEVGGIVYGNVSNASTIYGTDKFSTPRGHGFAAEQANHLYDKIANADFFGQNKVQMVGEDIDPQTGRIIKNGADRIVNGTNIQTKYCKTGGKCISECFDNGKFKYLNPDGTPMQVEVPSDKYDAAVQAMENRIKNGEVPGVTDPKEAKNIVRKGHFTYEQAKNIAKAGTVESITFDAVNGAIIATSAFGISTVLSFATSVWNGEEFDVAIKNATYTGLKVGGTTFITAVLSSQLSKAGLNSALVSSSEAIVSIMGPKASAMLVNAFRSGTNIYGAAAMKSAAKMLRGNAITGAVSVAVLSSVDVVNIFRGRISGKQLFKNVANTASTVAGGTAGWVGGATAGAAIGSAVPIIGTAIGGIVGGLLGSFAGGAASSTVSNAVLGAFIEDDAEEMTEIIEKVFQEMAADYLLNQKEAENIIDELKDEMSGGTLKDMFASSDRKKFARNLLIGHVENEVKKRKKIVMPSEAEMQKSLRKVLEEMADKAHISMQTAPV